MISIGGLSYDDNNLIVCSVGGGGMQQGQFFMRNITQLTEY